MGPPTRQRPAPAWSSALHVLHVPLRTAMPACRNCPPHHHHMACKFTCIWAQSTHTRTALCSTAQCNVCNNLDVHRLLGIGGSRPLLLPCRAVAAGMARRSPRSPPSSRPWAYPPPSSGGVWARACTRPTSASAWPCTPRAAPRGRSCCTSWGQGQGRECMQREGQAVSRRGERVKLEARRAAATARPQRAGRTMSCERSGGGGGERGHIRRC